MTEILSTIGVIVLLGIYFLIGWKCLTHPTTGKIDDHYQKKYNNYHNKHFPPSY